MTRPDVRRRWIICLAGGLFCCVAGLLMRVAWRENSSVPKPKDIISPNPDHDRLDYEVVKGLKYSDPDKGWSVSVGAVEIRRKPIRFIRIGAFNEALIRDIRLTMDLKQDPSNFATLLRQLGSSLDMQETMASRGGRNRARLTAFLEQLGAKSPYHKTRVSSVRIQGISLLVTQGDANPDLVLLSADSATFHGTRCRLGGSVEFSSLGGQRITCREAELTLATEPMISTHTAILQAAGSTQEVEAVSLPLAALLADEDLRFYANQSRNRTR
ncbi:MAG: hypothetical protein KA248_12445 [Kiritimatiellae bacterium]|nr:hypothetical protein [Kiritimatiellia bacterium]